MNKIMKLMDENMGRLSIIVGLLTCLAVSFAFAYGPEAAADGAAGSDEDCQTGNCIDGTDACYTTCSPLPDPTGKYWRYLPAMVEKCINTAQPPCLTIQCKKRWYDDSACSQQSSEADVDKPGCRFRSPDE